MVAHLFLKNNNIFTGSWKTTPIVASLYPKNCEYYNEAEKNLDNFKKSMEAYLAKDNSFSISQSCQRCISFDFCPCRQVDR
jgi:hypothetical protein